MGYTIFLELKYFALKVLNNPNISLIMKKIHEHTKNIRQQPVKNIMSKKALVKVHKDTHIHDLIKLMEKHDTCGFPVVDDKDDFIGDVHERDLLQLAVDPHDLSEYDVIGFLGTKLSDTEFGDKVEDIMTKHDTVVHQDTVIEEVVLNMWKENLRQIPVVDDKDKFVGVVSEEVVIENVLDHMKRFKK